MQAAERLRCVDHLGPVGLLGDNLAQEDRGAAKFVREAAALCLEHVADHHLGAFGDQQPRLGGALAARAAADDHNLVLESRHCFSPVCPCRLLSLLSLHGRRLRRSLR